MASRVLVRRRSCIVDYARSYARSPHCLQILCHGQSTQHLDSPNVPNVGLGSPVDQNSQYTNSLNTVNRGVGPREDLINFSALGLYRSNNYGSFSPIKPDFGRRYASSMSLLRDLQSLRHASTATAGQPRYDDEEKEVAAEKKKQASPEECDQAVVGLNTAKAKVKSKLQDSQSTEKSLLLQRMWTKVLGIGPTLRVVASMNREDWAKKLVHMKKHAVSTFKEYWLGTKLLWANVRISFRLLEKLAGGKSLSRRERQLFMRTTIDIFRLVPLAVFLIVPFMEFLLPVALTIFPNMLPSTFKNKMKEQEQLKRKLNARIEYAKFLQDTAKQMAKEVQHSRIGEMKQTAEDLDELLNKVRKGSRVSNDEILAFAKLFNDELTLDNISRPRLVNMCKYMAISPYGTDAYLRYMLRQRLRRIKEDDKMIQAEGIESLSEAELREDCRERGMLGLTSVQEMRQQLRDWLDLSLNHSVPSSLLILSRAFMVSGKVRPEDAVQATLSSLPDEVVETVSVTSLPSEDSVSERRRKLEFLEKEEELIKEEEEDREEEQARLKESIVNEEDVALKEMTNATAKEVHERAIAKAMEKHENFCELSRALAVLASASSVSREREEFLRLVTDEIELYNSMVEKEGTEGEADAFKAYKAAREESEDAAEPAVGDNVTDALRDRIDGMLHTLEKEIDDVDAKIGDGWRLLDRDFDGKVTPEEVAAATMYLKDTLGKEGEGIQELISSLSKDRDGKILVEDIVKLARRSEDEDSPDDRVNH